MSTIHQKDTEALISYVKKLQAIPIPILTSRLRHNQLTVLREILGDMEVEIDSYYCTSCLKDWAYDDLETEVGEKVCPECHRVFCEEGIIE